MTLQLDLPSSKRAAEALPLSKLFYRSMRKLYKYAIYGLLKPLLLNVSILQQKSFEIERFDPVLPKLHNQAITNKVGQTRVK